ncbi:RNA polymerase sigma factor [Streptodolium elevatio]|uniref:RNA polymerase sigma factor n=1 Tax=Streptodolium elevatio TaxID=3157996 RepID=A0ABV3DDY3_9ACTN
MTQPHPDDRPGGMASEHARLAPDLAADTTADASDETVGTGAGTAADVSADLTAEATSDVSSDDQWQRLRAGDEAARIALYEKHHEGLRRWFRAKLPSGVDADDCVSEVFVRALDGIARNADIRDGVDQWLWGIARYVLIEQFKAKKRRTDAEFEDGDPASEDSPARTVGVAAGPAEPGLVYGKQQAFDALFDAAASLSRAQRTVVSAYLDRSLAEMREFKGAELAAYLDWPDKKVHTELSRGMSKVFEQIGLLAAARAMRSCPGYRELTEPQGPLHSLFADDRTGPRLVPTRKEYAALKKHAPVCSHCSTVMRDAVCEKQWALGPGIALVAAQQNADDDERRRTVLAWWTGRGPAAPARTLPPPPAAGAAVEGAVADVGTVLGGAGSTGAGPFAAVGRVVRTASQSVARPVASAARTTSDAMLRQALRVPGVNSAVNATTRVAAENPLAVRVGGALVALGTAAAVTLAAVAPGDASQAASGSGRPEAGVSAPPDGGTGEGSSPPGTESPAPTGSAPTQSGPPGALPPPGGGSPPGPSGTETGTPAATNPDGTLRTENPATSPTGRGSSGVGGDGGTGSQGNGDGNGGGNGTGGSGGSGNPVVDPPPPPPLTIRATWGFWQLRYPDDPVGTTRDLGPSPQHPGNAESNWTYGSWRLGAQSGRKAQVTHVATGRHVITLPDTGAPGGVAHAAVNVFSDTGASCQTVSWWQQGVDEAVEVACFDRFGAPADVPFTGMFLGGTQNGPNTLGVSRGYVHASDAAAGRQEPAPASRQNTGAVTRTGTGSYTMAVPPGTSTAQVTPVGNAARHCAVTGLGGGTASIACTTYAGAPADTGFALSHTGGQSLLDDRRVPHGVGLVVADSPAAAAPTVTAPWMSRPGNASVTRTGTGRYTVRFDVGYLSSYTHVTATGGGYCSSVIRNDYAAKNDVTLTVACFTASGAPANSGFQVTYMTASPQYP